MNLQLQKLAQDSNLKIFAAKLPDGRNIVLARRTGAEMAAKGDGHVYVENAQGNFERRTITGTHVSPSSDQKTHVTSIYAFENNEKLSLLSERRSPDEYISGKYIKGGKSFDLKMDDAMSGETFKKLEKEIKEGLAPPRKAEFTPALKA